MAFSTLQLISEALPGSGVPIAAIVGLLGQTAGLRPGFETKNKDLMRCKVAPLQLAP